LGALKGSISFTKFKVRGELPEGFRDTFVERLRLRAFRPLSPLDDADRGVGWCSIENMLDLEIEHGKVFFETHLNVGLRIDTWQIPSSLFKAHFAEAEREHLAKKGREKLGRQEKEELKAVVTTRLRKQLMPVTKVIDLSWNLDTGAVRFWSQSARVHELLDEIFEDTFKLTLLPEGPYTTAARLGLSELETQVFAELKPTAFHAAI
jgi:recombination associated protein RdgC